MTELDTQGFRADRNRAEDLDVKAYFDGLGAEVQRLWREADFDEQAFPDIAARVLIEQPPSESVSFWDAVKFAFLTGPLPAQSDLEATFAQPPLTVYSNHEFRVELLFWAEGLPDIHQHSFSGAFHVMHGSSLHTEWTFDRETRLSKKLLLGKLHLKTAELLRAGDTRAIHAGSTFIHATYHLDRPSISVVIRTHGQYDHYPQYVYLPPSICFAASDTTPTIKRRTQMLVMLAQAGREQELLEIVLHFLEVADTFSVFQCVLDAHALLRDETDRNRMLTAVARMRPELAEALRPALAMRERHNQISALRRLVTNPDLQFFLGLLLNVPDRQTILNLIQVRHPRADAADRVVGWVREMSRLSLLETKLTDSSLNILRGLLLGRNEHELPGQEHEIDALRGYWLFAPFFSSTEPLEARAAHDSA